MRWETPDGRISVTVVRRDDGAAYRLISFPGRYWHGDYRSPSALAQALAGWGAELADLEIVHDDAGASP